MNNSVFAFHQPVGNLLELSDEEFLRAIAWKSTAPSALSAAARAADSSTFGQKWRKHAGFAGSRFGKRKRTVSRSPLQQIFWSRHAFEQSPRHRELLEILSKLDGTRRSGAKTSVQRTKQAGKRGKAHRQNGRAASARSGAKLLSGWLDRISAEPTVTPFELLVLMEWIVTGWRDLSAEEFWKLWRTTLTVALALSADLEEPEGSSATEDQRLVILGELPWKIGLLFDEIQGADQLRRQGEQFLNRQLIDQTDTDGIPHAELVPRLSLWVAPLVRAAQWANAWDIEFWNDVEHFGCLLEKVVPLCRPDGRIALSNGVSHDPTALLQSALQLAGYQKKSPPLNYLLAIEDESQRSGRTKLRGSTASLPKPDETDEYPAAQSDWAHLACLRSDLTTKADALVVTHHEEKPVLDLTVRGMPLLDGRWDVEVRIDGEPLAFEKPWSCVCWYSDQDADYLELQKCFPDGLRIERQLLLSRNDRFLLLADSISGAEDNLIEYTSRLPLVDGLQVESRVESRECVVKSTRQIARAFPLALPQDRVMSTAGGFGPYGQDIVLKQVAQGNGLYAPLVLDWKRKRRRTAADWRTLTVTEDGQIQPAGVAAGHRLRIGDHQLLIYRSLKPTDEPRAVLGHQTRHESVVGRFGPTGQVTPILLVEQDS